MNQETLCGRENLEKKTNSRPYIIHFVFYRVEKQRQLVITMKIWASFVRHIRLAQFYRGKKCVPCLFLINELAFRFILVGFSTFETIILKPLESFLGYARRGHFLGLLYLLEIINVFATLPRHWLFTAKFLGACLITPQDSPARVLPVQATC